MIRDSVVERLMTGPPWLQRRVRIDLLEDDARSSELEKLRRTGLAHPPVAGWIEQLRDWPGPPLKGHKTLALLIHKLAFLADIGLRSDDPEAQNLVSDILDSDSPEGPFRLPIMIPKAFGGSGEIEDAWILTDAPVVVGSLARMGLENHPKVIRAADYLVSLVRDNGWPCAADPVLGRFKGPGPKADSCPYATLVTLRMISEFPREALGPGAEAAVSKGQESLLSLWSDRRERRPYMFGMGSDFLKLKAPFVWYDILHVMEVLSRFEESRRDPRFLELLTITENRADEEGFYTAESVYRPAAMFDFGGKKAPSLWITFLMIRMRSRMEASKKIAKAL